MQPDLLDVLDLSYAPELATTSCSLRQAVSPTMASPQISRIAQEFTSREAIYASLRAAFPNQRLHSSVEVSAAHTPGECSHIHRANPSRRRRLSPRTVSAHRPAHFAPETCQKYAVTSRGEVVDESQVSEELVSFFDDRFSFCPTEDGGHALCYFIPGRQGKTESGARVLNWVWYVNADEGPELDGLLTDTQGHRRSASVPADLVNEEALADLRTRTMKLESHFGRLIQSTPNPFIQAILDIAPPAMRFGQVCLLGDAAFVIRPHTAAATAKAAADAIALAQSLRSSGGDFDRGLSHWEGQRMAVAGTWSTTAFR